VQRIERIVFFGTPAFAVPSLDALVGAGRSPILVVSQPARPSGRGRRLAAPPLAERARELGLPVEPVERVRAPEFLARLAALAPDLGVVVAFGQIFPPALLELPRLGCVNVHASLLPRWRGAAPIAAAIAAGDAETGVAVQQMAAGLDSGPVFATRATAIGPREDTGALSERLAHLGAALLVETIGALERGEAAARPQDESAVTLAPKLTGVRELALELAAADLERLVRAHTPEPGAVLALRGERVKVIVAAVSPGTTAAAPGTVIGVAGTALRVAAGAGTVLDLVRVQRPGGRAISGRDLANGLRLAVGDRLG
jgi:methionyl-tRNA formyltransferase